MKKEYAILDKQTGQFKMWAGNLNTAHTMAQQLFNTTGQVHVITKVIESVPQPVEQPNINVPWLHNLRDFVGRYAHA